MPDDKQSKDEASQSEQSVGKTLADLKGLRASSKGNLSRTKNLIIQKGSTLSEPELECRLGILESYFKQILNVQSSIERFNNPDEEKTNEAFREEVEEIYVCAKTKIMTLLSDMRGNTTAAEHLNATYFPEHPRPRSKLEPIKLPTFSGKFSEYPNFMGLFTNLVHKDESLDTLQKFNYLLRYLSGSALDAVRDFNVVSSNYQKALDRLKARFDNKTLLFQEHINSLLEFPKLSKISASSLRHLEDSFNTHFTAMLAIGNYKDIASSILISLAMDRVDEETQSKWQDEMDYNKLPTWDEFNKVLDRRCKSLEAKEARIPKPSTSAKSQAKFDHSSSQNSGKKQFRKFKATTLAAERIQCEYCKSLQHFIDSCPEFDSLPVGRRFLEVKKRILCINCLGKDHSVRHCTKPKCSICSLPHNKLLHRFSVNNANDSSGQGQSSSASLVGRSSNQTILATAVVLIKDSYGNFQPARVLLDSASQLNFITESMVQRLRLSKSKADIQISGIGNGVTNVRYTTKSVCRSRISEFETELELLVIKNITNHQPSKSFEVESWKIPKNIVLADPNFNETAKVDMLIGADHFFDLLSIGQIKLEEKLTLQKTLFGWVVSGSYDSSDASARTVCLVGGEQLSKDEYLHERVEKLFEIENYPITSKLLNPEEEKCEEHFKNTVEKNGEGRYVVSFPFKEDPSALGESFEIAKKRFMSLERRLMKNIVVKEQYVDFLKEYEDLGHMSEVSDAETKNMKYFCPHQYVLRPESTTTKLRVVFDCSAKTSSGKSLNDILMKGPIMQDDLYSIILRFRCYKYALTADISKMYRQIVVNPNDRKYQCILWRSNQTDPLKVYQLNTVTYGTTSAPYLAIRCLKTLSEEGASMFPLGSKVLNEDFYMDDLISGGDSPEEIFGIYEEVRTLLLSAGFELRKWWSNEKTLLDVVPEVEREKPLRINDADIIKTLGIKWNPSSDELQYVIPEIKLNQKITKRIILSELSTLFDPLGLVNPVVVKGKILLQSLWVKKTDWDESVQARIFTEWEAFRNHLKELELVKVPRYVLSLRSRNTQIHGFSDASLRAYGCCVYLRSVDENGVVSCNLITAKSRVAPIKTQSLPRLELCAAELLASIILKILPNFSHIVDDIYLWTDSEIVLCWLSAHPSSWEVFIANRVSKIQTNLPQATWKHVNTKQNPADIVSRGAYASELRDSMWFSGPKFLKLSQDMWPKQKDLSMIRKDTPGMRKCNVVLLAKIIDDHFENMYLRFKSIDKTCQIFALILRWIIVVRKKMIIKKEEKEQKEEKTVFEEYELRYNSPIRADEIDNALLRILWNIQQKNFHEEIYKLKKEDIISPTSPVKNLNPFLDGDSFKLLRVGGRLQNADIPYSVKYPILLPKSNPFVKNLLTFLHNKNYHAGPQALVGIVRQRFWVLDVRTLAKKVVSSCWTCFKYRPKMLGQIMGNLPTDRVQPARAFLKSGVDFCGPFQTTYKLRGQRTSKSYVAVFVCFVVKAVHLEVVSDLTTEGFIAALKRFVARRGLCKDLYCDNGTNFVGARNQLEEFRRSFLDQKTEQRISQWCAAERIQFHHIPPKTPHFGGLWEAAVKSAKKHLVRTVGETSLTFEELSTVVADIEAILNSRPMYAMSNDPSDEEVLTPGHFLIGGPLNAIVEPVVTDYKMSALKRWRQLTLIKQHFWNRWSKEYLVDLQRRVKWSVSSQNAKINSLVLVGDDNAPPQNWLMGRITNLIQSSDGKVRVVDINTKKGVIRRSIHRIAPLPLDD
ncbi:uncharacterized protein LOC129944422 [Eupeodes corollae]|uniref:uncharacterized protein LOC129944422 n=1 Tax=Eupeodes corollae TaxID=290404 RepID=UPI0024939AD0|nr:uncharacterized protein LOC129944422 [Eupeodes corollae]